MEAHLLGEDGGVGKGSIIENHTEDDLEELELGDDEHAEKTLLLLPAPPEDATLACLQSLYAPSLAAAFQQTPSTHASILDVAIHVPDLSPVAAIPRCKTFAKTQRLLARLYSSIHSAAVEEMKESLVDVRIVFLSDTGQTQEQEGIIRGTSSGPVVSLRKLADSGSEWRNIVVASPPPKEGEEDGEGEGEVIAKNFLAYRGDKIGHDTVVLRTDLGEIPENASDEEVDEATEDGEEHSLIAGKHLSPAPSIITKPKNSWRNLRSPPPRTQTPPNNDRLPSLPPHHISPTYHRYHWRATPCQQKARRIPHSVEFPNGRSPPFPSRDSRLLPPL